MFVYILSLISVVNVLKTNLKLVFFIGAVVVHFNQKKIAFAIFFDIFWKFACFILWLFDIIYYKSLSDLFTVSESYFSYFCIINSVSTLLITSCTTHTIIITQDQVTTTGNDHKLCTKFCINGI